VEERQVHLPVLRFSPISITPATLHTHLHLNTILTRRLVESRVGTFI
jgi:hypothetical protein